jgi:hypothetical protein
MENICQLCKQPISPELAKRIEDDIQELVDEKSGIVINEAQNKLKIERNDIEQEKTKLENKRIELEKQQQSAIDEKLEEINEQFDRDKIEIEEKANKKLKEKERETNELEIKNKRALKEIEDAKDELDAVKKKLQTKQADITGQIGQDEFVKLLRESFPNDSFKETHGGVKEADIIHTIRENNVEYGNLICYDVKKEKTPNLTDIENAKAYREIHGTSYSIIIASSMPVQEIPNKFIGRKNNVLIIHSKISIEVIKIIRNNLIMIEHSKNSVEDRDSKQAKLFDYVLGQDFQTRISSLFYSIQKFNKLLELEERQFNKAKKEKLAIIKELKSSLKINDEISDVIETEIKIKSIELELDQIETE